MGIRGSNRADFLQQLPVMTDTPLGRINYACPVSARTGLMAPNVYVSESIGMRFRLIFETSSN